MTFEEAREWLAEINPEALLADGFEAAFLGVGRQFNKALAIYDYDKCVQVLMDRDGMSEEEALEFMEFNVTGAYAGEFTPVFMQVVARDGTQPRCVESGSASACACHG